MTEPNGNSRTKWWSSRMLIVALGLTIGLSAKWLRQTWEFFAAQPAAATSPDVPRGK